MSLWWMKERGGGLDNREGVMKIGEGASGSLPPQLDQFLHHPTVPSERGFLDKMSQYNTWQLRYWELRGPYLMYWINELGSRGALEAGIFSTRASSGSNSSVTIPQGVIDTREVKIMPGATMLNLQTSKGRVIRLRLSSTDVAAAGVSRRPSAQFKDPSSIQTPKRTVTLEDWKKSIEKAASSLDTTTDVPVDGTAQATTRHTHHTDTTLNSEHLQGEKDPSFDDISSMRASSQSTNMSAFQAQNNPSLVNNRTTTSSPVLNSLHSGTKTGDIELGDLRMRTNNTVNEGHSGIDITESENVSLTTQTEYSSEHQLPNGIPISLYYVLAVLGACPFFSPAMCQHGHLIDMEDNKGHQLRLSSGKNDGLTSCFGVLDTDEKKVLASRTYQIFIRVCVVFAILWTISLNLMGTLLTTKQSEESKVYDKMDFTCSSNAAVREGHPPPCLYMLANIGLVPLIGVSSALAYIWILVYGYDEDSTLRTHRARCAPRINNSIRSVLKYFVALTLVVYVIFFMDTVSDKEVTSREVGRVMFQTTVILFNYCCYICLSILVYCESRRLRYIIFDFVALVKEEPFSLTLVTSAYQDVLDEVAFIQKRFGFIMSYVSICLSLIGIFCLIATYYIRFSTGISTARMCSIYAQYAVVLLVTYFPLMVLMRALILFGFTANAIPDVCLDLLTQLPPAALGHAQSHQAQDATRLLSMVEKRPCKLLLLGYEVQAGDGVKLVLFVVFLQIASSVGLGWLLT